MNTVLELSDVFGNASSKDTSTHLQQTFDDTYLDPSFVIDGDYQAYMDPELLFSQVAMKDDKSTPSLDKTAIIANEFFNQTSPEMGLKRKFVDINHQQNQQQEQQMVSQTKQQKLAPSDVDLHQLWRNPQKPMLINKAPQGYKPDFMIVPDNSLLNNVKAIYNSPLFQNNVNFSSFMGKNMPQNIIQHLPSPPTSVNTTPKSMSKAPNEVPDWQTANEIMMNMINGSSQWRTPLLSVSSPASANSPSLNAWADLTNDAKKKTVWTPDEDALLLHGFKMYPKQWAKIASMIPGRTNQQVKQRWSYVLNEEIRNGPWSEEEDRLLIEGFKIHGKQWAKIASMIPGRTNIQCRNRWKDVLDPSIKSEPWSEEEDELLQRGYLQYGSKWSKISAMLPGRTGLQCRDRFLRRNSSCRKRK